MKIGIDLGGSHIGVGLVDAHNKIIKKIEKIWTSEDKSHIKESLENYIVDRVQELSKEFQIKAVGIGAPGTQKNGVMVSSGKLGIDNYHIVENLQKRINLPIKIRNDAKCAAMAEDCFGALKLYDRSLFISLGTGVGGAVLLNHKLLDTGDYPGCEIGHMVIEKNGEMCTCGRRGCWQQYASMKILKNKLRKEFGYDETVHGKQLVDVISSDRLDGEKRKKVDKIIDEYIENLSVGLANLINIFEPQVVVIGGSFVFFQELLLDKLKQQILESNMLFNNRKKLKILPAVLGNDAGIIGSTL